MSQGTSERNELRSSRFFAPLHTTASWKDTAATQNAENSTRNMASGFEAKETTPKGISSAEPTYVMDDEQPFQRGYDNRAMKELAADTQSLQVSAELWNDIEGSPPVDDLADAKSSMTSLLHSSDTSTRPQRWAEPSRQFSRARRAPATHPRLPPGLRNSAYDIPKPLRTYLFPATYVLSGKYKPVLEHMGILRSDLLGSTTIFRDNMNRSLPHASSGQFGRLPPIDKESPMQSTFMNYSLTQSASTPTGKIQQPDIQNRNTSIVLYESALDFPDLSGGSQMRRYSRTSQLLLRAIPRFVEMSELLLSAFEQLTDEDSTQQYYATNMEAHAGPDVRIEVDLGNNVGDLAGILPGLTIEEREIQDHLPLEDHVSSLHPTALFMPFSFGSPSGSPYYPCETSLDIESPLDGCRIQPQAYFPFLGQQPKGVVGAENEQKELQQVEQKEALESESVQPFPELVIDDQMRLHQESGQPSAETLSPTVFGTPNTRSVQRLAANTVPLDAREVTGSQRLLRPRPPIATTTHENFFDIPGFNETSDNIASPNLFSRVFLPEDIQRSLSFDRDKKETSTPASTMQLTNIGENLGDTHVRTATVPPSNVSAVSVPQSRIAPSVDEETDDEITLTSAPWGSLLSPSKLAFNRSDMVSSNTRTNVRGLYNSNRLYGTNNLFVIGGGPESLTAWGQDTGARAPTISKDAWNQLLPSQTQSQARSAGTSDLKSTNEPLQKNVTNFGLFAVDAMKGENATSKALPGLDEVSSIDWPSELLTEPLLNDYNAHIEMGIAPPKKRVKEPSLDDIPSVLYPDKPLQSPGFSETISPYYPEAEIEEFKSSEQAFANAPIYKSSIQIGNYTVADFLEAMRTKDRLEMNLLQAAKRRGTWKKESSFHMTGVNSVEPIEPEMSVYLDDVPITSNRSLSYDNWNLMETNPGVDYTIPEVLQNEDFLAPAAFWTHDDELFIEKRFHPRHRWASTEIPFFVPDTKSAPRYTYSGIEMNEYPVSKASRYRTFAHVRRHLKDKVSGPYYQYTSALVEQGNVDRLGALLFGGNVQKSKQFTWKKRFVPRTVILSRQRLIAQKIGRRARTPIPLSSLLRGNRRIRNLPSLKKLRKSQILLHEIGRIDPGACDTSISLDLVRSLFNISHGTRHRPARIQPSRRNRHRTPELQSVMLRPGKDRVHRSIPGDDNTWYGDTLMYGEARKEVEEYDGSPFVTKEQSNQAPLNEYPVDSTNPTQTQQLPGESEEIHQWAGDGTESGIVYLFGNREGNLESLSRPSSDLPDRPPQPHITPRNLQSVTERVTKNVLGGSNVQASSVTNRMTQSPAEATTETMGVQPASRWGDEGRLAAAQRLGSRDPRNMPTKHLEPSKLRNDLDSQPETGCDADDESDGPVDVSQDDSLYMDGDTTLLSSMDDESQLESASLSSSNKSSEPVLSAFPFITPTKAASSQITPNESAMRLHGRLFDRAQYKQMKGLEGETQRLPFSAPGSVHGSRRQPTVIEKAANSRTATNRLGREKRRLQREQKVRETSEEADGRSPSWTAVIDRWKAMHKPDLQESDTLSEPEDQSNVSTTVSSILFPQISRKHDLHVDKPRQSRLDGSAPEDTLSRTPLDQVDASQSFPRETSSRILHSIAQLIRTPPLKSSAAGMDREPQGAGHCVIDISMGSYDTMDKVPSDRRHHAHDLQRVDNRTGRGSNTQLRPVAPLVDDAAGRSRSSRLLLSSPKSKGDKRVSCDQVPAKDYMKSLVVSSECTPTVLEIRPCIQGKQRRKYLRRLRKRLGIVHTPRIAEYKKRRTDVNIGASLENDGIGSTATMGAILPGSQARMGADRESLCGNTRPLGVTLDSASYRVNGKDNVGHIDDYRRGENLGGDIPDIGQSSNHPSSALVTDSSSSLCSDAIPTQQQIGFSFIENGHSQERIFASMSKYGVNGKDACHKPILGSKHASKEFQVQPFTSETVQPDLDNLKKKSSYGSKSYAEIGKLAAASPMLANRKERKDAIRKLKADRRRQFHRLVSTYPGAMELYSLAPIASLYFPRSFRSLIVTPKQPRASFPPVQIIYLPHLNKKTGFRQLKSQRVPTTMTDGGLSKSLINGLDIVASPVNLVGETVSANVDSMRQSEDAQSFRTRPQCRLSESSGYLPEDMSESTLSEPPDINGVERIPSTKSKDMKSLRYTLFSKKSHILFPLEAWSMQGQESSFPPPPETRPRSKHHGLESYYFESPTVVRSEKKYSKLPGKQGVLPSNDDLRLSDILVDSEFDKWGRSSLQPKQNVQTGISELAHDSQRRLFSSLPAHTFISNDRELLSRTQTPTHASPIVPSQASGAATYEVNSVRPLNPQGLDKDIYSGKKGPFDEDNSMHLSFGEAGLQVPFDIAGCVPLLSSPYAYKRKVDEDASPDIDDLRNGVASMENFIVENRDQWNQLQPTGEAPKRKEQQDRLSSDKPLFLPTKNTLSPKVPIRSYLQRFQEQFKDSELTPGSYAESPVSDTSTFSTQTQVGSPIQDPLLSPDIDSVETDYNAPSPDYRKPGEHAHEAELTDRVLNNLRKSKFFPECIDYESRDWEDYWTKYYYPHPRRRNRFDRRKSFGHGLLALRELDTSPRTIDLGYFSDSLYQDPEKDEKFERIRRKSPFDPLLRERHKQVIQAKKDSRDAYAFLGKKSPPIDLALHSPESKAKSKRRRLSLQETKNTSELYSEASYISDAKAIHLFSTHPELICDSKFKTLDNSEIPDYRIFEYFPFTSRILRLSRDYFKIHPHLDSVRLSELPEKLRFATPKNKRIISRTDVRSVTTQTSVNELKNGSISDELMERKYRLRVPLPSLVLELALSYKTREAIRDIELDSISLIANRTSDDDSEGKHIPIPKQPILTRSIQDPDVMNKCSYDSVEPGKQFDLQASPYAGHNVAFPQSPGVSTQSSDIPLVTKPKRRTYAGDITPHLTKSEMPIQASGLPSARTASPMGDSSLRTPISLSFDRELSLDMASPFIPTVPLSQSPIPPSQPSQFPSFFPERWDTKQHGLGGQAGVMHPSTACQKDNDSTERKRESSKGALPLRRRKPNKPHLMTTQNETVSACPTVLDSQRSNASMRSVWSFSPRSALSRTSQAHSTSDRLRRFRSRKKPFILRNNSIYLTDDSLLGRSSWKMPGRFRRERPIVRKGIPSIWLQQLGKKDTSEGESNEKGMRTDGAREKPNRQGNIAPGDKEFLERSGSLPSPEKNGYTSPFPDSPKMSPINTAVSETNTQQTGTPTHEEGHSFVLSSATQPSYLQRNPPIFSKQQLRCPPSPLIHQVQRTGSSSVESSDRRDSQEDPLQSNRSLPSMSQEFSSASGKHLPWPNFQNEQGTMRIKVQQQDGKLQDEGKRREDMDISENSALGKGLSYSTSLRPSLTFLDSELRSSQLTPPISSISLPSKSYFYDPKTRLTKIPAMDEGVSSNVGSSSSYPSTCFDWKKKFD